MNTQIQSVKFDAGQQLIDFIETKLQKLEHFEDKITKADVFLKLEKDVDHGNKVVTINLSVPGENIVAEHRAFSFEEATDHVVESLKKQIEKYKNR